MSGIAKWGYWCLKYFIITVREYIWFSLDWEASVQQPWSVLQIWGFWAADPATCCGPNGPPNRGTSNHLLCHFSSLPELPVLGTCRSRARSVCAPVHAPDLGARRALSSSLARSGGSCCASKWSGWESCSSPEIRSTTDNGSPSS